jgi:hypothetical protein
MVTRHLPARQVQVARHAPADGKRVLLDRHGPLTKLVGHFKSGLGHENRRGRVRERSYPNAALPR